MNATRIWAIWRMKLNCKKWRFHVICDPGVRPRSGHLEWTYDGFRYRYVKYVPEQK